MANALIIDTPELGACDAALEILGDCTSLRSSQMLRNSVGPIYAVALCNGHQMIKSLLICTRRATLHLIQRIKISTTLHAATLLHNATE